MATFDEFYAFLDPHKGIRGKQFEKFVKWFLKTDPNWASTVDEVWLWNEYPQRWGSDCGIDLIFLEKFICYFEISFKFLSNHQVLNHVLIVLSS